MRYKEITINASIEPAKASFVKKISDSLNKNELFIKIQEDKVTFFVRKIDLKKFQTLLKMNGLEDDNVFIEFLTELDKIKSYGINSGKRIYIDYNNERKVKNRIKRVKKRGAYNFYAKEFDKKNNVLPKEFINKIICSDSEQALKKIPDNSIDLIFTSPPYNFGLEYKDTDDSVFWQEYFNKLFAVFKECIRVLKYSGRIVVNIQPLFSDYIPSHHIVSNFFMEQGLIWKGEILWEKNNYNCKYTAWGSWKSPSSPYLKYTWEFLEIFVKGDLRKKGDSNLVDISADEFKKWVIAKWSVAPERNMKKYKHPAMFPEELVKRVLKLFSYREDIVLDPFNGVGSTTAVAKKLSRRFLGIDISKEYCDIAVKRLEEVENKPLLLDI